MNQCCSLLCLNFQTRGSNTSESCRLGTRSLPLPRRHLAALLEQRPLKDVLIYQTGRLEDLAPSLRCKILLPQPRRVCSDQDQQRLMPT